MMNPYYTTYMINFRFPSSTHRSTPHISEWICAAWTSALKYGSCAFNTTSTFVASLFKDPEPPATTAEVPAATAAPTQKPEDSKP